ncbi:major facilitator superfamily-domain-containing protein [Xylariaceae sp. FL0016]|nr:major facilitator superfamily-domain-containing protein [Xylariaceae sp. FL0016]
MSQNESIPESRGIQSLNPPVGNSSSKQTHPSADHAEAGKRKDGLDDQTTRLPFRRLITAYLCLSAIYFISTLDINSVATALPAISHSLGGASSITWTGTAYLMGQTAFQALYGRFSDIFGRKPVLLASIGFLVTGDILCGFAQNVTWLYVCRALSGVGGGGISSLVQIIVSDLVSLRNRGKYQGMLSGAIGLGAGTGPFIAAGMLGRPGGGADAWRWIFWVPPILAAACVVVMWISLPLKPVTGSWREKAAKIDWFGLLTAVGGVVLVLIPINSGGSIFPWNGPLVISMFSVGGFFLILFAIVEKQLAKHPLIPLHLFTNTPTAVIMIQSALYNWVWQVDIYFLSIYFQEVRGFSPLRSASLMLPLLLLQSLAGVASGPIMSKIKSLVLRCGMALWTLGAGLKLLFGLQTSNAVYIVALIIEGIGIGLVLQPALVALQALCRPENRAVATSTRNLMRMLGSVAGLAVSTAIQHAVTESNLPDSMPKSLRESVVTGVWQAGDPGSDEWKPLILDAKMKGIRSVFIVMVPLVGVCLLGCYLVPDTALEGDQEKHDDGQGRDRQDAESGTQEGSKQS